MKDLDFDELDKAVNSLMGGVKANDASEPRSKTLDINATLAPDEKPTYGNLRHAAERIGSEAIDKQEQTVSLGVDATGDAAPVRPPSTSSPAISPQKTGRFMDVVHPSSDMKRVTSKKVSREGATIEAPLSVPERHTESTPIPKEASEQAADKISETTGNLPSTGDAIVERNDEGPVVPDGPSIPEPLTSPFLPDAKVEKRPLGGEPPTAQASPEADGKPESSLTIEPDITPSKEDDSSVMDAITEPDKVDGDEMIHVPEEFQDELLAVEKNTDTVAVSPEKSLVVEQNDHTPPAEPLAVASIPKQYQEKPSTGEKDSGAIFDTDHYHKPLAHPPKKKSGWLWVLAIIAIVALGAGAGAFIYFIGF